jgi:DNA-binding winged helix-turn-helix (wHTH) protein/tetratricopeptide (TPR) repeat protein
MALPMPQDDCEAYRFDTFEVRLKDEILLRDGVVVPIQRLPFRMLVALLERAGELVSRDELQKRLWGEQTYLEFDNNLHVAATKLREALGQTGAGPRFVITEPRRGYRFVAVVTPVYRPGIQDEEPPDALPDTAPRAVPRFMARRARRPILIVCGCILGIAACVAAAWFAYRIHNSPIVDRDARVVLGGFQNRTGNPALDGILSGAFQLKLRQSPYLRFIEDEKFSAKVRDPDSATLKSQFAACVALDGRVLLTGAVVNAPHGYQVVLSEWRCRTGTLLATEKGNANDGLSLLHALDTTTEALRRRMGEPAETLQGFNASITQVTTSSLAALKAFGLGDRELARGNQAEAISNYRLAIDLDSQFVLAYARLGMIYSNEIDPTLARQYLSKAFLLRERTTDRERLLIAANYYSRVTGESQHAIDTYELWRSLYPYDLTPNTNLAIEFLEMGRPDKAIEPARAAQRLDASDTYATTNLALSYLETGDFSSLNALCAGAAHPLSVTPLFHSYCYQSAFAQNNAAAMQHETQLAAGNSAEILILNHASRIAMLHGDLPEADRLYRLAIQKALQDKGAGLAASFQLEQAQCQAELGASGRARQEVELALRQSPADPTSQALAALVYARTGDRARALTLATAASKAVPADTIVNAAILPLVHGVIALNAADAKAAIRALEPALPLDLNGTLPFASAYYRGLAYEQDHQWEAAAGEFRRVVDHRFVSPDSLYVVLSELELGHVLDMSVHSAEAAKVFEQVASTWRNASSDFAPRKKLAFYWKDDTKKHR